VGVKKENASAIFENVSIINFNYDRCLEQYVCHRLALTYGFQLSNAWKILDTLRVFRPYGTLGSLPGADGQHFAAFGEPNPRLASAASGIKTYTETLAEDDLTEAREWLRSAAQIVFLGFGFHSQNMTLLSVPGGDLNASVIGTAYKTPTPHSEAYRRRVQMAFKTTIELVDIDCDGLIQSYMPAFGG